MKKKFLIVTSFLVLVSLTSACGSIHTSKDGNNLEINKSSKKSVSKKQSTKKQAKPAAEQKKLSWNNQKSTKLDQTMQNYSKSKKYTYAKYDGKHDLKVSGGRIYPETFQKDKFVLDGKQISIGWSPQGGDRYTYKVLAIYNHDFDQKGNHETYLFCLHDKQPIVLMDTTKSGNTINLVRSNDKKLDSQFAGIMNGTRY